MYSETKFFLGANSAFGFVSYFKQLQEQNSSMQLLILKGGPGSGKSSLMKRVLDFASKKGHKLEIVPCASDPSSLDAIIDYTANFAMMDGTAPHTEDPSLPGARHHILYTGNLWDTKKLCKNAESIRLLSETISSCHSRACSYINAASSLLSENIRYAEKFIDREKACRLTENLIEKLSGKNKGTETKRLLSAVTVGEIGLFSETPYSLADKVYIIKDARGAAADFILKGIYHAAKLRQEPMIYCPCSLMPEKLDHLIFPESHIAVLTGNDYFKFHKGEILDADSLYAEMPLSEDMYSGSEQAKSLLSHACGAVEKAKRLHDDLEAFYVDAMNFDGMDALFDRITEQFYAQ